MQITIPNKLQEITSALKTWRRQHYNNSQQLISVCKKNIEESKHKFDSDSSRQYLQARTQLNKLYRNKGIG